MNFLVFNLNWNILLLYSIYPSLSFHQLHTTTFQNYFKKDFFLLLYLNALNLEFFEEVHIYCYFDLIILMNNCTLNSYSKKFDCFLLTYNHYSKIKWLLNFSYDTQWCSLASLLHHSMSQDSPENCSSLSYGLNLYLVLTSLLNESPNLRTVHFPYHHLLSVVHSELKILFARWVSQYSRHLRHRNIRFHRITLN